MRLTMVLIGIALVVTGAIWVFQGIGVLKGSFMTGSGFWAWMGGLAILFGLPLLLRGVRRTGS